VVEHREIAEQVENVTHAVLYVCVAPTILPRHTRHLQVIILGSGAVDYEERIRQAERDYPYYVRGIAKFDVPLSHR
jgi:glycogen synthase